jgi:hypothetical protein
MLQFVNVYTGPMLAVHGGGVYFIGNGDGGGGNNHLSIQIGGASLDVPIPASFKESWHHVAVVRSGATCTVYLDGVSKGTLTISAASNPSGTLRLGRSDEIHQQFYGFLDDVAVFKAALSASRIKTLAAAKTLRGTERNLLAGFVFGDGPGGPLPAKLTRPVTYVPATCDGLGQSEQRRRPRRCRSAWSVQRLPARANRPGRAGLRTRQSANGYAAFLRLRPQQRHQRYVFKASSPGSVAHVWRGRPNTSRVRRTVSVEQASHEFCGYLHLQQIPL